MQTLRLFDDMHRDSFDGKERVEPYWTYLNRTARPNFQYVRDILQKWFDDFDAKEQKRHKLCKDFRSRKDTEHLSAFWEIYLHHLFRQQNFDIEVEPTWTTTLPDFLLTAPNGDRVLLEATAIYPLHEFGTKHKNFKLIQDYLDKHLDVTSFYLQVRNVSSPRSNPPLRALVSAVKRELDKLDYDEIVVRMMAGFRHKFNWIYEDWNVEFVVMPSKERTKKFDRAIGVTFGDVLFVDSSSALKATIDKKFDHYGKKFEFPYLLAINVVDPFFDDDIAVTDALFGTESYLMDFETGAAKLTRLPDGVWFGSDGPQTRHLSGVLLSRRLLPTNMHEKAPTIWHHPYAEYPLSNDLLKLNQQVPNLEKHELLLRNGESIVELLQIDPQKMPI